MLIQKLITNLRIFWNQVRKLNIWYISVLCTKQKCYASWFHLFLFDTTVSDSNTLGHSYARPIRSKASEIKYHCRITFLLYILNLWLFKAISESSAGHMFRQSLHCSLTQYRKQEKASDKEPNILLHLVSVRSKKISNDQELIQSDPISCPQNQKGNN